jgi:hypothetical protein
MNSEAFASRLNRVLDKFDFPQAEEDRELTFCEYFNIPQPKAKMILSGTLMPRKSMIQQIAEELFIESEDLVGSSR